MDAVLTQHIVMTPDVCFGKPRIAGRRVAVMTIVIHILHMGGTPESAAHSYAVSLAEVYAALAFYYDNQHLINASIDENKRARSNFRRDHPDFYVERTIEISAG